MNTTETVNRIFELATNKGFKKKYLCTQLGVRPAYFTDCKSKGLKIPDNVLYSTARILETTVGRKIHLPY